MGFPVAFGTAGSEIVSDGHNNTLVTLPTTRSQAGYNIPLSEISPSSDAAGQTLSALLNSMFRRLKVGQDTLLFYENFISSATNSSNSMNQNNLSQTSQTYTISTGNPNGMQMNTGNSTTAGVGYLIKSYQVFHLKKRMSLEATMRYFANSGSGALAHKVFEFGLFQCTSANGAGALLDGTALRWAADGSLQLVRCINGTETVTTINATATNVTSDNVMHEVRLVFSTARTEVYVDDVLQLVYLPSGTDIGTFGGEFCAPLAYGLFSDATGPASAPRFTVLDVAVVCHDDDADRLEAGVQSNMGLECTLEPPGIAVGMTPSFPGNSTNPTATSLSNVATGFTGLGGDCLYNAPAGAATDYVVVSFQNPALAQQTAAWELIVTGVRISAANQGAAVATTPTLLQLGVAYGHTSVSLATTDGVATHAPRRKWLGFMSAPVGAAIGANYGNDIDHVFSTPITVHPSEFFAVIVKIPVGTATSSQTIRFIVDVDGYWKY